MSTDQKIENFLSGDPFAVVGASTDRAKYGNKVLRAYLQANRAAIPVHPSAREIEGLAAYPDLASIPDTIHGISIITPPHVTESIIAQAAKCGIDHVWIQPGAESEKALAIADSHQMNVIAGGPCILVTLQYREG